MKAILAGVGITAVWYGLMLYVNPFPRLEQMFCGSFASVIVSFAGFLGLSLSAKTLMTQRNLGSDFEKVMRIIGDAPGTLSNIEVYRNFVCDRIRKDFGFLKVFPNFCVVFGLLGTLVGIAQGVDTLAGLWAGTTDIIAMKSEISQFLRYLAKAFDSAILGLLFGIITAVAINLAQRWSEKKVIGYLSDKVKNMLIEWDKALETQPSEGKTGGSGTGDRSRN
ncbi:MAG: MotA/TolQ/ExbB proton channel family protein [Thermodesulforhabdaceae bacterium]